jgi:glycosyltransferase involved in cell wall biosynthesis
MAKLLIITQKVDINDPILGFFHRWLEKFAEKFEKIIVICLQKGEYHLPENVKVLSLGKEKYWHHSHIIRRLVSLYRFYKYIWQERKNYDAVFVHMNPIYVVLGAFFWRLSKKKIFLWHIHPKVDKLLRLANFFVNKVVTATNFTFPIHSKKVIAIGHGIDIELFKRDQSINKHLKSILFVGRIAPVKNIEILIESVKLLDKKNIDFILNIVGEAGEKNKEYFKNIKELSKEMEDKGKIKFWGKIENKEMRQIYNQNEILVNITTSGSFDKVILEAMACESLVLVSNKALQNILPERFLFKEKDPKDLADKIINLLYLPEVEKENYGQKFRQYVLANHSLEKLVEKIKNLYEKLD